MDLVHTHDGVARARKLVALSERMGSDAAFARQLRRKLTA